REHLPPYSCGAGTSEGVAGSDSRLFRPPITDNRSTSRWRLLHPDNRGVIDGRFLSTTEIAHGFGNFGNCRFPGAIHFDRRRSLANGFVAVAIGRSLGGASTRKSSLR